MNDESGWTTLYGTLATWEIPEGITAYSLFVIGTDGADAAAFYMIGRHGDLKRLIIPCDTPKEDVIAKLDAAAEAVLAAGRATASQRWWRRTTARAGTDGGDALSCLVEERE